MGTSYTYALQEFVNIVYVAEVLYYMIFYIISSEINSLELYLYKHFHKLMVITWLCSRINIIQ